MRNPTEQVWLALTRLCERLQDENKNLRETVDQLRDQLSGWEVPKTAAKPKDHGLIDGSRRGRFILPYDFLNYASGHWKDYLGVFQDLVVLTAAPSDTFIEYIAMSMKFDPVPEGERAPRYNVAFEKGIAGDINVQFIRQS